MADKNLNINIIAKDKSKQALGKLQGNLSKTKSSVLNLKNALIGLGAGLVIKSIVQTTARFQDLRTSLASVTGSAENGARAFSFISKFATKTQFSVEDLSTAFIKLKAAGIEPSEELLTTFTDTAAITTDQIGSLQAITDLYARTVSGGLGLESINRLGDRGVPILRILEQQLGLTRDQITKFGMTAEGAKTITDAFAKGIKDEFGGSTVALLDNLNVSFSNVGIALANVQDKVGQGMSPALKAMTDELTKMLEENEELAISLGKGLGGALAGILTITLKTVEAFQKLNETLEDNRIYELFGTGLKDLLVDVYDLGFGMGTLREEFPELASLIDKATNSSKLLSEGFISTTDSANNFQQSIKEVKEAMGSLSEDEASTVVNDMKEETESILSELKRRRSAEKIIQHQGYQKQNEELNTNVDRALKRQEAANKREVKLKKDGMSALLENTKTGLAAMAGQNKKAFQAYKAYQIAEATINAYKSASSAFTTYAGLFPLNIGIAAAALAAGMAQVSAIQAQTFSGRQSGGAVVAGQQYMVGEAGREMFVPSTNGNIVPNDRLGGGQNINITINANDTQGFDELLIKRRATIVNVINDALNSQGKEALV